MGQEGTKSAGGIDFRVFNDASGKRVVVAGELDRVAQVLRLLAQLDTGTDFVLRVYRLQSVSAGRMDKLIRGLVRSEESASAIETTVDEDGNLLIVRAPPSVHRQIETLITYKLLGITLHPLYS